MDEAVDLRLTAPSPRTLDGPKGWWTARRARLWLVACAVAAWLPVIGMPLRGWLDFSAFYAAGSLAFHRAVTDLGAILSWQAAHGLPQTPFVYPAGVALVYVPFAALPYGLAAALHAGVMTALLVLAAGLGGEHLLGLPRRWVMLGALAWGPAAAGVVSGQNTSLALLLVVLATLALVRGRDAAGGALAGLLAYKPQLSAPLGGLLLLRLRWTALAGFGLMLAGHYLAGVLATGGDLAWPREWLATISAYTEADFRANGWQAISLPALGRHLGLVTGLPGLDLVGYAIGGVVVLLAVPRMRRASWPEAVALACACGLVISPHAWVYDATLLLPALGVLAARARTSGWPRAERWRFAAAFAAGLSWPLGGIVGVTLLPLLVLLTPFWLLRGPGAPAGQAVAAST